MINPPHRSHSVNDENMKHFQENRNLTRGASLWKWTIKQGLWEPLIGCWAAGLISLFLPLSVSHSWPRVTTVPSRPAAAASSTETLCRCCPGTWGPPGTPTLLPVLSCRASTAAGSPGTPRTNIFLCSSDPELLRRSAFLKVPVLAAASGWSLIYDVFPGIID